MTYPLLAGLLAPVVLAALLWRLWRPGWMGFAGKSLWDWIALLGVPMVVGFATFLLTASQQRLERDRAAEAAVQHFIDRISALVLDEKAGADATATAAIGRAQTRAMLRLVRGERAGRVLGFLAEMDVLHRFSVEFEGLDLSAAELKGLDLNGLDFEGCILSGADLEGADLSGADLEGAVLIRADLKSTDLHGASLENAWLKGADLDHADLRGADLASTGGLTQRQLDRACLDQTTVLPPGFTAVTGATPGCAGAAEE